MCWVRVLLAFTTICLLPAPAHMHNAQRTVALQHCSTLGPLPYRIAPHHPPPRIGKRGCPWCFPHGLQCALIMHREKKRGGGGPWCGLHTACTSHGTVSIRRVQVSGVVSTHTHAHTVVDHAAPLLPSRSQDIDQLLPMLVPPVLPCLTDPDTRVRYYACEALYNISKVAFSAMLTYFIEIFNGLCEASTCTATTTTTPTNRWICLLHDQYDGTHSEVTVYSCSRTT